MDYSGVASGCFEGLAAATLGMPVEARTVVFAIAAHSCFFNLAKTSVDAKPGAMDMDVVACIKQYSELFNDLSGGLVERVADKVADCLAGPNPKNRIRNRKGKLCGDITQATSAACPQPGTAPKVKADWVDPFTGETGLTKSQYMRRKRQRKERKIAQEKRKQARKDNAGNNKPAPFVLTVKEKPQPEVFFDAIAPDVPEEPVKRVQPVSKGYQDFLDMMERKRLADLRDEEIMREEDEKRHAALGLQVPKSRIYSADPKVDRILGSLHPQYHEVLRAKKSKLVEEQTSVQSDNTGLVAKVSSFVPSWLSKTA